MKENAKFLKCPICDNIIEIIDGDVQHITCCGRKMEEMKANTTDAATEKHIPIYKKVEDNRTSTKVKQLTEEETITEIARIASGEITEITLSHAEALRNTNVA